MRNAFEEGQKRGYCGSTELEIVAPKRSWRDIFCRKPQQMKNSLNFANTCLKIVDTRRAALYGKWQPRLGGLEDDRILIASVVELLCHFLVSCSCSDNASFVLCQSNPRI